MIQVALLVGPHWYLVGLFDESAVDALKAFRGFTDFAGLKKPAREVAWQKPATTGRVNIDGPKATLRFEKQPWPEA